MVTTTPTTRIHSHTLYLHSLFSQSQQERDKNRYDGTSYDSSSQGAGLSDSYGSSSGGGAQARALYDYNSDQPTDLAIRAGGILLLFALLDFLERRKNFAFSRRYLVFFPSLSSLPLLYLITLFSYILPQILSPSCKTTTAQAGPRAKMRTALLASSPPPTLSTCNLLFIKLAVEVHNCN